MRFPIQREEDGSRVLAECSLCGGELYEGEKCYVINGEVICGDCLEEYARQVFAGFARYAGEEEQR